MPSLKSLTHILFALLILIGLSAMGFAQRSGKPGQDNGKFGPVMQAYLGYLANEQEVVDDRISRREISAAYYHRNSNRIQALRTMAIRLVRQSGNDYVPELEAVTVEELGILFEKPPRPSALRPNEAVANKFRFLGTVQSGEAFYVFARLDPYEQAELMQRQNKSSAEMSDRANGSGAKGQPVGQTAARPRRVVPQ